MDRDLMKLKKRQEFVKNRLEAFDKTMKKHPEGITKDNLERIKKELHREERLNKVRK